ncbi:MAG: hypothetical protein KA715_13420 [Xanthomonadaceae bacterium]|nr:hypothetical protein [Xanthomonadaceae bacterium]
MSCSPKTSSIDGVPVSVKSELQQLNPEGISGSTRSLTSSDIKYIESEIKLTPEKRAALQEVSQ